MTETSPSVIRPAWRSLMGEGFFMAILTFLPALFISSYYARWQENILTDETIRATVDPANLETVRDIDLAGLIWLAFAGIFLLWLVIAAYRTATSAATVDATGVSIHFGGFRPRDIRIDFDEIEAVFLRKVGIDGLLGVGGLGIMLKGGGGDLVVFPGLTKPERLAEAIDSRRHAGA